MESIKEWSWGAFREKIKSFDVIYDDLLEWIRTHGNLPSKDSKNIYEKKIGIWCSNMKKTKKNKLDKHKIEKLDGWHWDALELFDKTYSILENRIRVKKICRATITVIPTKENLACGAQRGEKKNGKLDGYKVNKMENLDGWYWEKTIIIKGKKI